MDREDPRRKCFVRNFKPAVSSIIEDMLTVEATPHHHIDHFNSFVQEGDMENIIEQEVPIKIRDNLFLRFNNARLSQPFFYDEKEEELKCLYPDTAILTKRSYNGVVSAEATLWSEDAKEPLDSRRIDLFKLPIMVGSSHCYMKDAVAENPLLGGHFIINGTTRTLIPFIRPNYNTCLVSVIKNDEKFQFQNEFRSRHQDLSILVKVYRDNEGYLFCSLPYIKSKLPAGLVLCAMGFPFDASSDTPIPMTHDHLEALQFFLDFNAQSMDRLVQQMTHDEKMRTESLWTPREAMESIVSLLAKAHIHKTVEKLAQELGSEIFVHMGFGSFSVNATYLCYMFRLLELTALGKRSPDDKESLANKRVDTCSDHVAQLTRSFFRRSCKSMTAIFAKPKTTTEEKKTTAKLTKKAKLVFVERGDEFTARSFEPPLSNDKIFEEMGQAMQNFNITNKIQHCFSTGKWDVTSKFQMQKSSNYVREGVSQVLAQSNQLQRTSHMRRVTQPIATDSINTKIHNPRQYGPTQNGFICPYETPEGGTVGIVCNFALSSQVSLPFNIFVAMDVVKGCLHFFPDFVGIDAQSVVISVDGRLLGHAKKGGYAFVKELRHLRTLFHLPHDIGIVHCIEEKEVRIHVDRGRFIRPMIVVGPNNQPLWTEGETYTTAKNKGHVRYVDAAELDRSVVAIDVHTLKENACVYEYLEIHPTFLLGHNASLTNYSNCNQAPRNSYVCSQNKHAMGTVLAKTHDTNAYFLRYAQKPLVSTMYHRMLNFDQQPSGCNIVVAVMTCRGYNQEDSVIVNKGALDRGLFSVDLYHVITDREKSSCKEPGKRTKVNTNYLSLQKNERWEVVPDAIKNPQYLHIDLDERGIILPHSKREASRRRLPLAPYQVLVSKKLTKKVEHNGKWSDVSMDHSLYLKTSEAGGFVDSVEVDMDADGLSVVRITLRFPHTPEVGDKVASAHGQKGIIGAIYASEDMPFDGETGMVPDLIINPHAFPSRMTINYIMDMAMGLLACQEGRVDATPFEHDVEKELELLEELGMNKDGTLLSDGRTGEHFPCRMFCGPVYYHALSHLVSKKMYARGSASSGPVDAVRQPVSGRSREGGLRFGEMERDCVIAHGAAATLDDRFIKCSDEWNVIVCNRCKDVTSGITCHMCGERNETRRVVMGFATKVMHTRMQSMGVKLAVESKENTDTLVTFNGTP